MSTDFLRAEAELVLTKARAEKAKRIQSRGCPIQLSGTALDLQIRDGYAWVAENTALTKKINLETGSIVQLYRGHTGPVSSLTFCDRVYGSGDGKILITGSWDKTIKLWNTDTKEVISSTDGHSDFIKCFLVLPSLQLLVSGGSDNMVRIWDLSAATEPKPLTLLELISSHTRPVSCLCGKALSGSGALLYTADTMGIIRAWDLIKASGNSNHWSSKLIREYTHHRTKINEMTYGNGHLWTASADETVQIVSEEPDFQGHHPVLGCITHGLAVQTILPLALTDLAEPYLLTGSGDTIRAYDVSSLKDPELLCELDAHWHDVTAIRLWSRQFVGADGKRRAEPWIVSTSLDGTIRKWRLSELLSNQIPVPTVKDIKEEPLSDQFEMTEEEERELAELIDVE